jgi:hypothetical protein
MVLTASKLRQDIYRILDRVAETGVPVEIVGRRRRLKIVAADGSAPRKIQRLKVRPKVLIGDPQRLVHVDWSKEWKP